MERYEAPVIEVIEFETQDIMTSSVETDNQPLFLD